MNGANHTFGKILVFSVNSMQVKISPSNQIVCRTYYSQKKISKNSLNTKFFHTFEARSHTVRDITVRVTIFFFFLFFKVISFLTEKICRSS